MHYNLRYKFGILAEKIAIIFLTIKGYKILEWRYKTHGGEVDIIAQKSHEIIFIEVKARKTKLLIEEVLRPQQIKRIKRAAEIFIAKNPRFHDCLWRFDFIEVGRFFIPKHHKNFIS
ncbi:MAG: hypothetical protein A2887_03085 [Alphaproteobacteria bacterium RIFCSPLOWO2_01_FULL_40_26]|nr:MAG: hypothetical protein A3D15_05675 [Alphaproteobacteria bacterium RIFCSPHIGHO2_02_FULL_40_34]OFW87710.1 MAG: hypothetical protein A2794_00085 [Alphaproteobacteria bacterium RIFCSPHIGHO2_01_FULL_40_8]OFW95506.1 MAG: hypothetical protein A2887_03085 [Alphaproteobacteria bacterium RIFCSPLOWO2_01_FULL_40_26]OFX09314.1 MAG: hypothetical protein A3H30_01245 [Alphaproteobacteria bacterium RIFCSPLOWO2_02_FULL_40_19]OFX10864.1 MAG: hypothetical protein A3G22_00375 [Alphaproteobacteria bacterium RI